MNKRTQAFIKATQHQQGKPGITGGYETYKDPRGVTLRRWKDFSNPSMTTRTVPNPTGKQGVTGGYRTYTDPRGVELREWVNYSNLPTKKPTQGRPQPPKVNPPSQTGYTPTPEQQWIMQQREQGLNEQLRLQKAWFEQLSKEARDAQERGFIHSRGLQNSINDTTLGVQEKRTWGDIKTTEISSEANKWIAETQGKTARDVADINAGSAETVANINARSAFDVTELETKSKNYGYDKQYEWTKYQADRDAETRNKYTDAFYFVEREKNANQKEKNKQDFYLNAGLGILDSMNKQRASSSQAAAQIYSSFLSGNPYNFKYWN